MRRNKNKGMTLIETIIVVAVSFAIMYGVVKIFKNIFEIYWTSSDTIALQQKARTALNEMTRFIRQSSAPVTNIDPGIGETKDYIQFVYIKDASTTKNMKYYKSDRKLLREVDGETSTLIDDYLTSIYFTHISSYVVKIQTMTLSKRDETFTFNKTIYIRNR